MVPQQLFKVVFDPTTNTYAAFIMPNLKLPVGDLPNYVASIADVERLTGLQLFPTGSIDKTAVGTLYLAP